MKNKNTYFQKLILAGILSCLTMAFVMAQDVAVFRTPTVSQDTTIQESTANIDETNLKYSKTPLNQDFDFELNPLEQGKFSLNVLHDTKAMVSIKVYDIIGNVLYEENVRIRGSFKKEFDLSTLKTKFFIVEIGNKDFNKTKSIVVS